MIKKIAWDAFKNTGDINAFLELKQIENIENNIKEIQEVTNLNLEDDQKIKKQNKKKNITKRNKNKTIKNKRKNKKS